MEIDQFFAIQLGSRRQGDPLVTQVITASELFDPAYVESHDSNTLNCRSPWKHDDLRQYVTSSQLPTPSEVDWLQLNIVDRRTQEHRRVMQQRWGGNWISVDWTISPFRDPECVLLLEVAESSVQSSQLIKILLKPLAFSIRGHSIHTGSAGTSSEKVTQVEGYENRA